MTHSATMVVLYGFLVHLAVRAAAASPPLSYLRTHRLEMVIALLIILHLALPGTFESIVRSFAPAIPAQDVTRLYVALSQAIVALALIPPAMRYGARLTTASVQPSSLIALTFLAVILVGTGLLMLPRATVHGGMGAVDALFTAASAVCVTGLTVVDTASTFTPTGHAILLILIQVGGLGIMTLTTFFAFMSGSRGSLKQFSTLQDLLGEESIGKIRNVVLQIGAFTLVIEVAGAGVLWWSLDTGPAPNGPDGIFFALFHAVSAFCNAGFTVADEHVASQLFTGGTVFPATVMVLVVLGGLGFPVLVNLVRLIPRPGPSATIRRLSLHTRLVLITTAILLVAGGAGIFLLERGHALAGLPLDRQIFLSFFYSVSARTAGFATAALMTFSPAALFLLIILMWVGASPGSTGGGVKTTTVAVAWLAIRSIVTGRHSVEAFRHRLPERALLQAFSTIALSLGVIGTALFLLLLIEPQPFFALAFETVSALGTVGLSTGITPALSTAGKLIIIAVIFTGRIGVLALVLALSGHRPSPRHSYTEEPVHIT